MALVAGDVKIDPTLTQALGTIGQNAKNQVGSIYNQARARYAADNRGFGSPSARLSPGSYGADRFATTQGLSEGNLEAGMGEMEGSTAYNDRLLQRDYDQQRQLAEATADALKPSLLSQIFSGIGGAADAGGRGMALYNMLPRNNMNPRFANTPSTLSINPTDNYGFENYGLPAYRRGGY